MMVLHAKHGNTGNVRDGINERPIVLAIRP